MPRGRQETNDFGDWVTEFCFMHNVLRKDLAESIGVKPDDLSKAGRYIKGKRKGYNYFVNTFLGPITRHYDLSDHEDLTLRIAIMESAEYHSVELDSLNSDQRTRFFNLLREFDNE